MSKDRSHDGGDRPGVSQTNDHEKGTDAATNDQSRELKLSRRNVLKTGAALPLVGGPLYAAAQSSDASQSSGTVLAYDGFNASTGPLNGKNSGVGWSGGWKVQGGDDTNGFAVADSSLDPGDDLYTSGKHAVGGDGYKSAGRRLDTSSDGRFSDYRTSDGRIGKNGTTIWMSVLLRQDDSGSSQFVDLDDGGRIMFSKPDERYLRVGYGPDGGFDDGGPKWGIAVREGSSTAKTALSGVEVTKGDATLLVTKLSFGSTNTFDLYVNPDNSTLGGNAPSSPDATLTSAKSSFPFRDFRFDPGIRKGQGSIDEIRFGTSYAAVTPTSGQDLSAPSSPPNLSASVQSATEVKLDWDASSDDFSGVASYNVYVDGEEMQSGLTETQTTVAGLDPSTEYTFGVTAVDKTGKESGKSTVKATTGKDTEAPTTPSNLQSSNLTSYSVDLSWKGSSDNIGLDHYDIYANDEKKTESAVDDDPNTDDTATTVGGLLAGKEYDLSVTAVDTGGNESGKSNTVTVTTEGSAYAYDGPSRYGPTGMPEYNEWTNSEIGAGGKMTGIFTCEANRNVVYARSDVSGTYRSDDGGGFWYMIHDGDSARGVSIDPRDEDNVVLVKNDGIYHSPTAVRHYQNPDVSKEDDWSKPVSANFPGANSQYRERGEIVARNPDEPDVLVTAKQSTGDEPCVYRSTDNGKSWTLLESGPSNLHPIQVAADPLDPGTFYLTSRQNDREFNGDDFTTGIWKSTDNGKSWSKIHPGNGGEPIEFTFDPQESGVLYGYFDGKTGKTGKVLKRSTDGGASWSKFEDGLADQPLGAIFASDETVYVARSGNPEGKQIEEKGQGLLFSLPAGGSEWSRYAKGGYADDGGIVDQGRGDELWSPGGFISLDNVGKFALDPVDPDRWYLAGTYALYRSMDAGKSWTWKSYGVEEMVGLDVVADPEGEYVHLGIADTGYFQLDGDAEKSVYHPPSQFGLFSPTAVNQIAVSPDDPNRVYISSTSYASFGNGKLVVTDDKGRTILGNLGSTHPDKEKYAVFDGVTGKKTGLPHGNSPPGFREKYGQANETGIFSGLSVNPTDAMDVVGGIGREGPYRSKDGGKNWSGVALDSFSGNFFANPFVAPNELSISGDGSMVAGPFVTGPIQYYDPDADSWSNAEIEQYGNAFGVEHDPGTKGRFGVAIIDSSGGAYESRDGGESWDKLVDVKTTAIAFDPDNQNRIAVGPAENGRVGAPLVSVDGGETFVVVGDVPATNSGDTMTFTGDRLVVGAGGSSYLWTDVSDLESASGAPSVPTNVSVGEITADGSGGAAAEISWDGADGGPAAYNVYLRKDGKSFSKYTQAYTTDTTIEGLASSTSYDVKVSAVGPDGSESATSDPVSFTTPDVTPPNAPSNLALASQTDTSVTVTWDGASDEQGGSGLDHYNVYRGGEKVAQTNKTTYTLKGLDDDSTYTVAVSAVDGAGNESERTTTQVTTGVFAVIDAPSVIDDRSKETFRVEVLTTDAFDAVDRLNPDSVRFDGPTAIANGNGAQPVTESKKGDSLPNTVDADFDGDKDVLLHFRGRDTGFRKGETRAVLVGETKDGQKVVGYDRVVVRGGKRKDGKHNDHGKGKGHKKGKGHHKDKANGHDKHRGH